METITVGYFHLARDIVTNEVKTFGITFFEVCRALEDEDIPKDSVIIDLLHVTYNPELVH